MEAPRVSRAAFCVVSLALLGAASAASPALPVPERAVDLLVPAVPVSDGTRLRQEALARLPVSPIGFPADAELDEPRRVGGQTWLNGRYRLPGGEVCGGGFALAFDEEERWFAFLGPAFRREALEAYPGPATLTSEDAEATARRACGDWPLRLAPLCYSVDLARWIYAACHSGAAGPPGEPGTAKAVLIDGRSGVVLDVLDLGSRLSLHGTCRGTVLPLEGPGVRRAHGAENGNVPIEMPLPFIPLRLFDPGQRRSDSVTDAGGSFRFELAADGLWGLKAVFDTVDFTLAPAPGAQTIWAETFGNGERALDLELQPRPGSDVRCENIVGAATGWIRLHQALRFAEELQGRTCTWPRGFGGKQELVRGMPAFYNIQLVRLPVPDGRAPALAGGFLDAFPPFRTMWISEGNDLFHDWTNPALWHEFGHALVSAFTGQINDPPPNHHDGIVEEFAGDFFALLMMERLDPSGEIPHVIGRGKERGRPESFQRDVRDCLKCVPEPNTIVPCLPRKVPCTWPPPTDYHDGSLMISAFFYDLWVHLVERYGREGGFRRIADTFIRYIDRSRGDKLPPFDRTTVYDLLIINDNPDLGGDNILQNESPDWDLIVEAASRRNLWLHPFSRGDANQDGTRDLSDAIFLLGHLFLGGAEPRCLDAADSNDDASLDVADSIHLLLSLFGAGAELVPPLACDGLDPTPDDRLTCISYSACPR
ncbi:MAG: hypothetical protein HY721_01535 [Planctomycetes bacterium]|nr:hypothetical protein [Planctomycetota bacterium]